MPVPAKTPNGFVRWINLIPILIGMLGASYSFQMSNVTIREYDKLEKRVQYIERSPCNKLDAFN